MFVFHFSFFQLSKTIFLLDTQNTTLNTIMARDTELPDFHLSYIAFISFSEAFFFSSPIFDVKK